MKKTEDLISIIIPVYQVAAYLERCVESIIKQTYSELEILLVDDGSTDGSGTKCDELAARDQRIRVIHEKNAGVSAARNAGLDAARGELIAFCDADDYTEPDMYGHLAGLLQQNSSADMAACSGWYEYGEHAGKPFEEPESEVCLGSREALRELHRRHFLRAYVWNKLFRREVLRDIRFSEALSFGEDYDMICRTIERCRQVVCSPQRKYHYIQRKSGACNHGYDEKYRKAARMFAAYKDRYACSDPEYRKCYENHYIFDMMGMIAAMSRNGTYDDPDCRRFQREIREHFWAYVFDASVPVYLKGSACAICIHARLFGRIYRWMHRADYT